MKNSDRRIIIIISTIIVILVSAHIDIYQDLNVTAQENDINLIISDPTSNNSPNSTTTNNSGIKTQAVLQSFTISCTDFMKLFDTISALDIGEQVSEKKVNQTALDDIEQIFNSYAGNCSQLDEYEFE